MHCIRSPRRIATIEVLLECEQPRTAKRMLRRRTFLPLIATCDDNSVIASFNTAASGNRKFVVLDVCQRAEKLSKGYYNY